MAVLMFQPAFHEAVTTGAKRQTIRPPRKRPIRPGERLSLRAWTGTPYRSPQRVLREARCQGVERVVIDFCFDDDAEALRDGFESAEDMRDWFIDHHALPTPIEPFVGERISWDD